MVIVQPSLVGQLRGRDRHLDQRSGNAEGWLINVVPEGFTPEDAEIRITWGASSSVGPNEENLEQFNWTYDAETWVDSADAQ